MLNITVFTNRLLLLLGINIFTLHLICFNLLIPPLEITALNLPQTLLFSFITMIYKKNKKENNQCFCSVSVWRLCAGSRRLGPLQLHPRFHRS